MPAVKAVHGTRVLFASACVMCVDDPGCFCQVSSVRCLLGVMLACVSITHHPVEPRMWSFAAFAADA
jgi:hypothetical protein